MQVAMPAMQLIITVSAAGEVNVSGPIENKFVCYGLLEFARDLVRDYKPKEASRILRATGIPPNGRVS